MKKLVWFTLSALVLAVAACGGTGSTDDTQCEPGTFKQCDTTCDTKGTQTCDANGMWAVCAPPMEVCDNGVDDDCNGQTDAIAEGCGECVPNATLDCVVTNGTCQTVGKKTCGLDKKYGACAAVATEICNEKDDNCNGQVDEGLNCSEKCTAGTKQPCLSTCGTVGETICVNGTWGACTPGAEQCNNKDDDCDTKVDEDIAQQDCTNQCGAGKQTCANGVWSVCNAPLPAVETCDGKDNDCDKLTDEGEDGQPLTQKCNACNTGVQTCAGGTWSACPPPPAEVCDGLDNDCNQQVDDVAGGCTCSNGAKQPCGTDTGECSKGEQTCTNGKWSECGGEKYKASSPEKCDGLDNDCNGVVDEGDPEGGAACGTPNKVADPSSPYYTPCQVGVVKCKAGQLQCIGGVDPTPEVCDEVDNDCNGTIDDNISGDQYEKNNTCATAEDLGYVIENQGKVGIKATMFPDNDIDWFTITGDELAGFCLPWDDEGPYQLTVKLTNIPEGADYDLCVWSETDKDCGDLPDTGVCEELGIWKGGNDPETFTYEWTGACASSDATVFYVKVVPYSFNPDLDCQPYSLEFEVKSGF